VKGEFGLESHQKTSHAKGTDRLKLVPPPPFKSDTHVYCHRCWRTYPPDLVTLVEKIQTGMSETTRNCARCQQNKNPREDIRNAEKTAKKDAAMLKELSDEPEPQLTPQQLAIIVDHLPRTIQAYLTYLQTE
jgi:hypothetical protein